ncbi:zinc finger RNA-binding protein 2 [Saccopteryx bilineata]|uniref:zinc finger RNA-binding protein 2 n=1 Tax=Saccopteryx bilineata TaxID=59482 RepID=UPI00338FBDF1
MAAGGYYGFSQGAGPQYSVCASSFCRPSLSPHSGIPVTLLASATQPPRSSSPAGYGGYQSRSIQDFDYGSGPLEPTPTPTTTPSYQESFDYRPSTATISYENKQYHLPAVGHPQQTTMATFCQPGAKGAYCQPSSGYSQAHPLQQAPATRGAQPACVSSSSYTYCLASSDQPTVFMSTLPSYTSSSSYSFTSTPYTGCSSGASSTGSFTRKPPVPTKLLKPKGGPKQPLLHYCDICKISCAGAQTAFTICRQTYREHLEGQKHKKKEEAAGKMGIQPNGSSCGVPAQLLCDLCAVSCTGAEAYAAHIWEAKHQKVFKLHIKLGKLSPTIGSVPRNSSSAQTACTPKPASFTTESPSVASANVDPTGFSMHTPSKRPVCNDEGKVIWFRCKLCECSFNDLNARDMHVRGRRHQLQYRKKVNPHLPVSIKLSNRAWKLLVERKRKQKQQTRKQLEVLRFWHTAMKHYDLHKKQREQEPQGQDEHPGHSPPDQHPPPFKSRPGAPEGIPLPTQRPESSDDRHVLCKHATIYPTEEELLAVQKAVSHSSMLSSWCPTHCWRRSPGAHSRRSILKGVMQVRILVKGLLLRGDRTLQLILLCSQKPTCSLLQKVSEQLPQQLQIVTNDRYEVSTDPEANIIISSCEEPRIRVTVSVTLPLMREDPFMDRVQRALLSIHFATRPVSRADIAFCAAPYGEHSGQLHAVTSYVLVQPVQPTQGGSLDEAQAMELLVEKALSSAQGPPEAWGCHATGPGVCGLRDAPNRSVSSAGEPSTLERIAETPVIAPSGSNLSQGYSIFFANPTSSCKDGPGIRDPCERDNMDVLESMTLQEQEDVTASAQHALRMLAFRQIHKILGIDPLPPPKSRPGSRFWKRPQEARTSVNCICPDTKTPNHPNH